MESRMPLPPNAPINLYGCWRSTSTHRITLALSILGIPFDYSPVNLDTREQEQPIFRKVSPEGQLPVLTAENQVLTQSMAIVSYLDEIRPAGTESLFPDEPLKKAQAVAIAERINSFIHPFLLPRGIRNTLIEKFHDVEGLEDRLSHFVRDALADNLQMLEDRLSKTKGPFAQGETITIADIFVFPQLVGAARIGVDVNSYPRLSKLYEAMERDVRVRAVDPHAMPDAPGNQSNRQSDTSEGSLSTQPTNDTTKQALAYKEPTQQVSDYLNRIINKPIVGLETVRNETFKLFGPVASKVSAIDVCFFLRWAASQMQARRALEVGVFTGSSSLAILEGMGIEGTLDAIDISSEYTAVAQQAWNDTGMQKRVNLTIEDGISALSKIPVGPTYDLAYVDALNENYQSYHQAIVPLMKQGGLIIFDNILWKGRVVDPKTTDPSAVHLRDLNINLRNDPRIETTFISMGDGLALCKVL